MPSAVRLKVIRSGHALYTINGLQIKSAPLCKKFALTSNQLLALTFFLPYAKLIQLMSRKKGLTLQTPALRMKSASLCLLLLPQNPEIQISATHIETGYLPWTSHVKFEKSRRLLQIMDSYNRWSSRVRETQGHLQDCVLKEPQWKELHSLIQLLPCRNVP